MRVVQETMIHDTIDKSSPWLDWFINEESDPILDYSRRIALFETFDA